MGRFSDVVRRDLVVTFTTFRRPLFTQDYHTQIRTAASSLPLVYIAKCPTVLETPSIFTRPRRSGPTLGIFVEGVEIRRQRAILTMLYYRN